tara:strand:+ start:210 stop:1427 length:1218 start_codon:yes stop_codon:yes gene_type:complete
MPNFPPNYKEQESYYSSQEYKDTATMALEQGNKLPTFEDKKAGKNYTPRRLHQKLPPLSYPLKSGPNQRTGDRLVIKCLKFEPPEAGAGATVTPTNLFKKDKEGNVSVYTTADRAKIKENIKNNKPGGYGSYTGDEKPGIEFSVTDANSRMSRDANRLMKYLIELPIPQDLSDSNSVTWGEDRANALELAALAVAQEAMQGNIGENAVNLAQTAVTALNTGIDIPGLKSDTQAAVRAALSGAAIGALGSNVSPQSVISRSTGQILNNNLELLFQGVNLRTFPYSITFSPRGPEEARIVKDIIRRLKTSMAPKAGEFDGTAGGIFIQSPDVFQLKFLKDDVDHPFLHAFKLCALTGMSVNYTNAGTYTSYEDGTPVNIRMSLTFKELNPIYHEDYMQVAAGPGVGY